MNPIPPEEPLMEGMHSVEELADISRQAAADIIAEQEQEFFAEEWTEEQDPDYPSIFCTDTHYASLLLVLGDAYDQAANGKGAQRHGQGKPFEEQPMQNLIALYGQGFALGQAAKKGQESMRMPYDAARRELLGGIVYLAGAVLALDRAAATPPIEAGDFGCIHFEVIE